MRLAAFFALLRPRQWAKNAFCIAPLFFSGKFLEAQFYSLSLRAALAFCCLSSAVYIMNDLRDLPLDRLHPRKRNRPLARGDVSPPQALVLIVLLGLATWLLSAPLTTGCALLLLAYLIINGAYSLGLKNEPVLEMILVSTGFPLRAAFGTWAIAEALSPWMLNSSFYLALFLTCGKRYAEMLREGSVSTRPALQKYTPAFLQATLYSAAVMACVAYGLFTARPGAPTGYLATIPLVVYCVFHYLRRILVEQVGEEPEKEFLRDRRLQLGLVVWLVIYLTVMVNSPPP